MSKERPSIRQVASVTGKLTATKPANRFAPLFTKQLEIEKNRALSKNGFDYDQKMSISDLAVRDLRWSLEHLPESSAPIRCPKLDYVIYTDASSVGWGCFDPKYDRKGGGRWTVYESKFHINYLELKAIFFGLQSLVRDKVSHVRIMTDNMTAVVCINKQGSTKSPACNAITREIWNFAILKGLWLSAAHCPGVLNVEADEASRVFDDQTEWALRLDVFQHICHYLGHPTIDLFVSRLNHKVECYCAWQPDPGAVFIDSFMYDWGQETLVYAFPPFSVIHMVLQKWIQDEVEGILIVPFWPTQPWFTLFCQLICGKPVTFDVTHDVLYLPFSHATRPSLHPLAGKLTLVAARCKDGRSVCRASQTQSSPPSCEQDVRVRIDCTKRTSGGGRTFVTDQGLTTSSHLSLRP